MFVSGCGVLFENGPRSGGEGEQANIVFFDMIVETVAETMRK